LRRIFLRPTGKTAPVKRVGGSLVLLIVLCLAAKAAVADFAVRQATARLHDGVIFVDAAIDFEFSDKALEALDNGVPLTIVVEVTVQHEGAWFWERDLVSRELRYEFRYHPLAGLYGVLDLETGIRERFATREAALAMLGELPNIEVAGQDRLDPESDYQMALRAFLDIESLPLPLQPVAYISPAWHLSTGWSRWRLRQ
jgi:hypothetical protein